MEAGKAADCYGCVPEHDCEQADAEQAYVQAELKGTETWVALPEVAWPDEWFKSPKRVSTSSGTGRGEPKFNRPVVLLKKALYGHPDAGTFWEQHCNKAVCAAGFEPIDTWPSCFFHPRLRLFLVVYVDDFKMAGLKKNLPVGWGLIRRGINMEDPAPAHLYLGVHP